jgi:hypothetical protein
MASPPAPAPPARRPPARRAGTAIRAEVDAARYFIERDSAAFRALLAHTLRLGQPRFGDTWREGGSTFVRLVTRPELASWAPAAVRGLVAGAAEVEFHDVSRCKAAAPPPPTWLELRPPRSHS